VSLRLRIGEVKPDQTTKRQAGDTHRKRGTGSSNHWGSCRGSTSFAGVAKIRLYRPQKPASRLPWEEPIRKKPPFCAGRESEGHRSAGRVCFVRPVPMFSEGIGCVGRSIGGDEGARRSQGMLIEGLEAMASFKG